MHYYFITLNLNHVYKRFSLNFPWIFWHSFLEDALLDWTDHGLLFGIVFSIVPALVYSLLLLTYCFLKQSSNENNVIHKNDHLVIKNKGLYWGQNNQTRDSSLTALFKGYFVFRRRCCLPDPSPSLRVSRSDGEGMCSQPVWVPLAQLAELRRKRMLPVSSIRAYFSKLMASLWFVWSHQSVNKISHF